MTAAPSPKRTAGTAPVVTDVTTTLGEAGAGGVGGEPGVVDGLTGVAVDSLDVSP
jgi:hypothetical protein